MRTLKITLEYDGSAYCGWQIQARGTTLQGLLEEKLSILTHEKVRVMAAGRTDAGVHAHAQVATFRTASTREPADFVKRLNALLPRDMAVLAVEDMPDGFDSRASSMGKLYRYQIWNAPQRSVFHERFTWHLRAPLDIAAMRAAAAHLVGHHDFSSFRAANCEARTSARVVFRLDIDDAESPVVLLHAEATAFLKNMVRIVAGTLVEVGQGKRAADSMPALLAAKDRTKAGRTAPAHGLFLVRVFYS